jgi:hypothetical protein
MAKVADRIPSGVLGGGAWMLVAITRLDPTTNPPAPGPEIELSICSEFSYDEDFHVNPAEVIGYLGPIAYDSQGYTCQITMSLYVKRPSSKNLTLPWEDIARIFPIRDDILLDGALAENILRVYDIATGDILNEFIGCVLSTNGVQIRPNSYITRNARFFSVERTI